MKKRSKFNLSYQRLMSCKLGFLIPIGLTEVLPGDSFRHSTSVFMRFQPMLAPVMHSTYATIHHWYVPNRLIFDDWEDFITGGSDGMDDTVMPTINSGSSGFSKGSLADYFGIPPSVPDLNVSALPFRAYNFIFNEWYRDQDLQEEVNFSKDSGKDTTTVIDLLSADWPRDYFTTSRPWPQKGPAITVPVSSSGTSLTVTGQPALHVKPNVGWFDVFDTDNHSPSGYIGKWGFDTRIRPGRGADLSKDPSCATAGLTVDRGTLGVQADFSRGSITIRDLMEAKGLQRYEEHRAMYGSRYVELLRQWGVRSSDSRLQRPEYLGGSKEVVQFSEVLQTAEGSDPVGTLKGHGIGVARSRNYRKFFEEHGFVMSLMLVRPKPIYMDGLPRMWSRKTKEDFWTPELQHIGQQEVKTQELYAKASPDKVFGYQNRYDEYRQHESSVTGDFRDILDYWHLARSFANEPVLNADFIKCVPSNRIFADQRGDHLLCMISHNCVARRLMSKFGNPI